MNHRASPSSSQTDKATNRAVRCRPIGALLACLTLAGACSTEESHLEKLNKQLDRIGDDKRLNTFITLDAQGARKQAARLDAEGHDGLLAGWTLTIKDNIEVAGLPNTAGTLSFLRNIPQQDAPIVTLLREAGGIIVGKANMHELGFGITSNNYGFGAVGNAHNPKYFAGGSSGGTAAAIAAGFVRAGLGSDTGGSVRIPAALNGIVGFRPTTGRYVSGGMFALSHTRGTVGPLGTNVDDVATLDAALSGDSPGLETIDPNGLRLGIPRAYFYENLHPDVQRVMADVFDRLTAAGIELVEADVKDVGALTEAVAFPVVLFETLKWLPVYLKRNKIPLTNDQLVEAIASPDVKTILAGALGQRVSRRDYNKALKVDRPKLQKAFRQYFAHNKVDALLIPTTPLSARKIIGSDETVELNGKQVPTFLTYIRNMEPSSNAGIPGLTIAAGRDAQGLPIGVEIESPEKTDRRLLAIGKVLEGILSH